MPTSYAMMASRVTPPAEDKGAEVDGAVEAGGVAVSIRGRLGLSCASLCQTIATFMALITRKETEKWCRSLVIVEGKLSLSRVVISLYTSMRDRIK